MNRFEKIILGIERLFDLATAIVMLAIMAVVVLDVALRYLFHAPLTWAYELIDIYLMVAVFFLSLSGTYAEHKHIGLDILVRRFSSAGRRWAEIFTSLTCIPLFGVIGVLGAQRAITSFQHGDAVSGLIAWPTWYAQALVPIGIALIVLRLLFRLIGQLWSVVTGREIVANIPVAVLEEAGGNP